MAKSKEHMELEERLAQVETALEEANDVIDAIRSGEVDALVVNGKDGHQLFTLKSADHTYRIFIEQMTESAVTLDRSERILYCNSQFAKLMGIPLEKVIGLYFLDLVADEDRIFAKEVIAGAWEVDTRAELSFENRLLEKIPMQISLKALMLDEGTSLSVILTDLTDLKYSQSLLQIRNEELEVARKVTEELNNNLEKTVKQRTGELESTIRDKTRAEEVLRSNEQRLTSILQTMGEGLCILDSIGQVTFANKRAQELFALNDQEITSRNFFTLQQECFSLTGERLEKDQHPISLIGKSSGTIYDKEIRIINARNESVYISINASPLLEDDSFIGTVMTFSDVSNRRKMALQKDEFISVASHEIKTPLTSLKASMQLLTRVMESGLTSDKIPVLVQKANSNLGKVVHLVDDLMNVSKIQHGPLPLSKAMINIAALVIACADQAFHDTPLKLVLEGDNGILVFADPQRLEQVFVNLFNNAVKYAPKSEIVKVAVVKEQKCIKISVQDFGKGIAADKLPQLFNRYYQVDPQGKQVSGLGLGLYISHEIIERHGGQLSVTSKVGEGTVFSFTLPITE
jgi:two-component system phosphate regulon sensor histidine kinase PhoR